jgi:hypothetical protein
MTPVDTTLIPTGKSSPMSPAAARTSARRPRSAHASAPRSKNCFGGGYDHNFVVKRLPGLVHR